VAQPVNRMVSTKWWREMTGSQAYFFSVIRLHFSEANTRWTSLSTDSPIVTRSIAVADTPNPRRESDE